MKKLFEQTLLGGIPVKNRLIRSAMLECAGDETGRFLPKMHEIYEELAQGGVGTIITGMVGVGENARSRPSMIDARYDGFVESLRSLAEVCHQYDCRLVVQIAHCGKQALPDAQGNPPFSVCNLAGEANRVVSEQDIRRIIEDFAITAQRCKEAGADGVQLHAAHGYFLCQTLSPLHNQRTDKYGGAIENRACITLETYRAVREAVGPTYPIWVKLNCTDRLPGGTTEEDFLWVGKALDAEGIDAIEVSGGFTGGTISPWLTVRKEEEEAYYLPQSDKLARQVKAAVLCVGGFRTPALAEKLLNSSEIQGVSLCRPFLCEPDLANRWAAGDPAKTKCISCNRCTALDPDGFRSCAAFPRTSYTGGSF